MSEPLLKRITSGDTFSRALASYPPSKKIVQSVQQNLDSVKRLLGLSLDLVNT